MPSPLHCVDRACADARDVPVTGATSEAARDAVLRSLLALAQDDAAGAADALATFRSLLDNSSSVPASSRRDLALGILRALPLPCMAFVHDDASVRPLICRFVESTLPDLLPEGLSSLQSHAKLAKLAALVPEAEKALASALATLTSLDRVKTLRQQLMRTLNARVTKPFLYPYLPPGFVEGAMGELFNRADAYVEASAGLGVVDAHRALLDALATAREQLVACGTEYAARFDVDLVGRLEKLVGENFATNRVAQPATMRVGSTDKRYPLHLTGAPMRLPLRVRNDGPGHAHDVVLAVQADAPAKLATAEIVVGRLAPLGEEVLEVPFVLTAATKTVAVWIDMTWRDFDGTSHRDHALVELRAQRTDVDWARARESAPYSLEPVDASSLVGRRDVLGRLVALLKPDSAGSAIVHGQKRVGKTSIARALAAECTRMGWHAVTIESGDYIDPSPQVTIQRLATRISRRLRAQIPGAGAIAAPASFDSLGPLSDWLEDVQALAPGKIVLILDEFDELPAQLYARDAIGNAFFLTLRSLTSRPSLACVLVGGEKMRLVLDGQGDKLNKWTVVPVDYFDREADAADYRELVRRPGADVLEFGDDAVAAVYEATAGNPYFTNLVCQTLYRTAVARQDCHVTAVEVEQAVRTTARETERNSFQHFWDDGIAESGEAAAARSNRRRRALIALADRLQTERPAAAVKLAKHPLVTGLDVESELRELATRKVLRGDVAQGLYDFQVPLFYAWLRARGIEQMVTGVELPDERLAERRREEELRVKPAELVELAQRWGSYRGQNITDNKIQAWLEQFGSAEEQRLMLRLLQSVDLFPNTFVRKKLGEIDEIVQRATRGRSGAGPVSGGQVLLSYLDGAAKSGAHYARLYAEESGLRAMDVVERGALRDKLATSDQIRAVVMVDDFVGTGKSAEKGLRELHDAIGDVVRGRDVKVVFATVAACEAGWAHVKATVEELQFGVQAYCCEMLDEGHKLFGSKSKAFPEPAERARAREIVQRRGAALVKAAPLGHGDLELGVVFERGCPNNTVPILWAESSVPRWMPLFKRM